MKKRDPRLNPQPGDRLVQVTPRGVFSRIVLKRHDDLIVYTRKRLSPHCHCRCHLIEWLKWAATAHVVPRLKPIRKYETRL